MKVIEVAAAVIRKNGRVLLASRPPEKPPAGWEFPGGKLEPGESVNRALVRELEEELGVTGIPCDELYRVETMKKECLIRLFFIRVQLHDDARIVPREGQQFAWHELCGPPPPDLLAPDRPVWNFLTNFGRN